MWMFYSVSSLTLIWVSFSEAATHTVLEMKKEAGYNVFDLWNLKYIKCGSKGNTDLYRHDYIDHMDPACVSHVSVIFEDTSMFHLRYDNPTNNVIEQILSRKPDYGQHRTPLSTDHFITKTSNRYEFIWLNQANTTLYGGIYHSTDISKAPQFVYNVQTNSPYTENGDPKDFNNINAANNIEIEFSLNSGCSLTSTASQQSNCPGKQKPTIHTEQNSIVEVYQGSEVTLLCSYTAYGLATAVDWTFVNSNGQTNTITEPLNANKYSGSTVTNPSLTIYNFAATDAGHYKCAAVNSKGRGEGTDIQVVMISASTTNQDSTLGSTIVDEGTTEKSTSTDKGIITAVTTSTATNSNSMSSLPTGAIQNNGISTQTEGQSTTTDKGIITAVTTSTATNSNSMNSSPTGAIQNNGISTQTEGQSQTNTVLSTILITSSSATTESCLCDCVYTGSQLSWLPANWTSYSTEELRIVLQPRLLTLEKELTVDKKSLSAYRNKLISAPDTRVSSKSIGVVGIIFLTSVVVSILVLDCLNIVAVSKKICTKS